ncbi:MAG TPA: cysteine desulfurase [Candidatus Dorea intestinavium]|nr:cysteine desulfurase [Candidatus Dorea intestinavium]
MKVYLDNAATTKAYEEVADLVKKVMCEDFGNPSSRHILGMEAEEYLTRAKESLGKELKVSPKEIFFTSGGTESDNLALIGGARALKRRGKHIISTNVEHPAIYNTLGYLEENGYEVTYLKVNEEGIISLEELKAALKEDTILVSIMHVNNEIGSIMPLKEIGKIIKDYNPKILFHVDGIQAYGKLKVHPKEFNCDLYSVSGHKLHGPKGVGLLYKKENVRITPIIFGGGQQKDLRSGTENVPGAAGIALASSLMYQNHEQKYERVKELKSRLIKGLNKIEDIKINSLEKDSFSPYIVSVSVAGIRGEVLLHALEEKGIYVSSGSACSSNHPAISGVLRAIGVEEKYVDSTIRFSFCESNTKEEIDYTLETLYNIVPMLRRYTRQ